MQIKRDITFPTKLDELKIKHVSKYLSLPEEKRSSDFELLMIFAGDLAKYVDHSDGAKAAKDIRKLIDTPTTFNQTFKYKGISYGIIPDLGSVSLGAYLDIKALEADGKIWENGHRILTVLFRPIVDLVGEEYRIQSYEGVNEALAKDWYENLSADVLVGSIAFFLILLGDLSNNFQSSSSST